MPSSQPVLRDTLALSTQHDLEFIMTRLDRGNLDDFLADLGVMVNGPVEDIRRYLAFSLPWDYERTQKLREHYALSFDTHRLTGFLVEMPIGYSYKRFEDLLIREKQKNRRSRENDDDIRGLLDVTSSSEFIECRYRYKRDRVKSDLSIMRDASVDTRFYVYDTKRLVGSNRTLFCIAIQPVSSSDYARIIDEFSSILRSIPGSRLVALSLRDGGISDEGYHNFCFPDCETSTKFILDLIENPVLSASIIRDVHAQHYFRWDGNLALSSVPVVEESEAIEEDLDLHLSEIRLTGAGLHKTKTTIAAQAVKKHAAKLLGIVFQSTPLLYYTNIEFKLQKPRLEVQVERIMEEKDFGSIERVYDSKVYWDTLWELWLGTVERYLDAVLRSA